MDAKSEKHCIIYVMRHVDIGGNIEIPYKKIGITGKGNATLTSRLQQISNTKSPIKSMCSAAWEHDDAQKVERAIHLLLEGERVEGEWFLDRDDSLIERMAPLMTLLGAKTIKIKPSNDDETQAVIMRENNLLTNKTDSLVGEISRKLHSPLKVNSRKAGPTIFGESFTYYINVRKSGRHKLSLGKSKNIIPKITEFLKERNYDNLDVDGDGALSIYGIEINAIIKLIKVTEQEFSR